MQTWRQPEYFPGSKYTLAPTDFWGLLQATPHALCLQRASAGQKTFLSTVEGKAEPSARSVSLIRVAQETRHRKRAAACRADANSLRAECAPSFQNARGETRSAQRQSKPGHRRLARGTSERG